MSELWQQIGITPAGLVGIVIATTVVYLVFTAMMAVWGRRIRSSVSLFSLALITLAGSVAARAMLGNTPTLMGGLVALVTLFVLERAFRGLRIKKVAGLQPRPIAVMVAGVVQPDLLLRCRMSEGTLWTKLRQAGVRHREEVIAAIVEPSGSLTVLRGTGLVDPAVLRGVQGTDRIPADLLDTPGVP